MLDRTKTDPATGELVGKYLKKMGVETPMIPKGDFDEPWRQSEICHSVKSIMEVLGLDLEDDSLKETPKRVAKMYLNEIFWGLDYNNFPKITTIDNKMSYGSMIIERNISVPSLCEHHLLPFTGYAHVAYIPNNKVLGLSKLNRIVEFFSRRPQVQERLAEQIYHALSFILDTEDVAVLLQAEHSCVKLRGVEDTESDTITSKLGGAFYKGETRAEFLKLINL